MASKTCELTLENLTLDDVSELNVAIWNADILAIYEDNVPREKMTLSREAVTDGSGKQTSITITIDFDEDVIIPEKEIASDVAIFFQSKLSQFTLITSDMINFLVKK